MTTISANPLARLRRSGPAAQNSVDQPMSDLNTTPLIDVMLVLLIMFIITIPIQTHGIKVDLPTAPSVVVDQTRNLLQVNAQGVTRWNGVVVDRKQLRDALAESAERAMQPVLLFEPESESRYTVVNGLLGDIRKAGVTKLNFVGNGRYGVF